MEELPPSLSAPITWIPTRSRSTRSDQRRYMRLQTGRCLAFLATHSRSCPRREGLQRIVGSANFGARGQLSEAPRTAPALRRCCAGGGGSGSLPCGRQDLTCLLCKGFQGQGMSVSCEARGCLVQV